MGSRFFWDPSSGHKELTDLSAYQSVICLSGAGIADKIWTKARRFEIERSRIEPAKLLAEAIRSSKQPPQSFLCASAVGFYGQGSEAKSESSPNGEGFLAQVCKNWEQASFAAESPETRVVQLRFGMVLHPDGGALARMLPSFKLGLGAVLGTGRQRMSWISREDALAAILTCLQSSELSGPVNIVSPGVCTNKEFSLALAQALRKPCFLRIPEFALKLLLGQMAEELLLGSSSVMPEKLLRANFSFKHQDIHQAFSQMFSTKNSHF
jgi:uncharacterized protein (TIGR01777 family)